MDPNLEKMPGEDVEKQKFYSPDVTESQVSMNKVPDMQEGGKIEDVVSKSFREGGDAKDRFNPVADSYANLEQKQLDQLNALQLPSDAAAKALLEDYSKMMGYTDFQKYLDYLSGMDENGKFSGFPAALDNIQKVFKVDRSISGLTPQQMKGVQGLYLSYMYEKFPNTAMGASIEGMNTLIGNQADVIQKEMKQETDNFVRVFGEYYENVYVAANLSSEALLAGKVAGE